jgi:cytochrome c peroxidase
MKRFPFLIPIFIGIIALCIYQNDACQVKATGQGEAGVKAYFNQNSDILIQKLRILETALDKKEPLPQLQAHFAQARYAFKKTEALTEYYFQGLTKRLNGPVLPDIKVEDGQVLPPHGFQVIEQYLFSPDTIPTQTLKNEIAVLITDVLFTKKSLSETAIQAHHFYELIQHHIIRIATQGIAGLDTPLSQYAMPEAVFSIQSLVDLSTLYHPNTPIAFTDNSKNAIKYLENNPDFNSFDRLTFIKQYLMPMSDHFKKTLSPQYITPKNSKPNPNMALKDMLEGKDWNADFFTTYTMSHTNEPKVALGKALFFEKGLSKNGLMSCGTCHQPDKQFTDGLKKAADFVHNGSLARNTPTIYYAGLQNNQFYDMRSIYLEDQIETVINNKSEFNLSSAKVVEKVLKNAEYAQLLKTAFPDKKEYGSFDIRNAIAAYVRSQNPFSSPFDDYMRGDSTALSQEAIRGFNLFMGKAKCGACHFIPIFNGTVPPWFNKSESEVIGVPAINVFKKARIDPDLGRYGISKLEELKYAFKTPTVRNAAQTAPYMHNGVYDKLEDVIEFYHIGGGVGIGIDLPNQSLPFDNLVLDNAEKQALIRFIQALSDKK